MNSRIKILFAIIVFLIFVAIIGCLKKAVLSQSLPVARATYYGDVPKSKRLLLGFGDQISHEASFGPGNRGNDVNDYLEAGLDPNYCLKMYDGWQYRNPLMLFCSDFINLSYYEENHEVPSYEHEVFDQLVEAGADIDKYPYVWAQVYLGDNKEITYFEKRYAEPKCEVEVFTPCYVADCNRVLRMFLDAGADVNRKGSPVPFDEKVCEKISEKKIQGYFNSPEATLPIYEAIKKGMIWESQVDLLLEYGAILDESCLEAARFTGDESMINKITKLFEEMQEN